MKRFIQFALILFVSNYISSCTKDPISKPVQSDIKIELNQAYVGGGQVDSAFAIWNIASQQTKVPLQVVGNQLKGDISNLAAGTGVLTVQLYGKNNYQGHLQGLWNFSEPVTLKQNASIQLQGPSSYSDAKWLPRIIMKDAIGHEAIVAMRPEDPYFLLKNISHETLKITVDRSYWKTIGGVLMAGQKIWNCTSNCTGVANEDYFTTLPTQIADRPWNHISITILYTTGVNGEGWVLGFEHDI